MDTDNSQRISNHFIAVLEQQLSRIEKINSSDTWINYEDINPIIIGMIGGDGIGPIISDATRYVLEELLSGEKQSGKILFKDIEGLTIENRASVGKAIPDANIDHFKTSCGVLRGIHKKKDYSSLLQKYDFRNLGKSRMNAVLNFHYKKEHYKEYMDIGLHSRSIDSVIKKLRK